MQRGATRKSKIRSGDYILGIFAMVVLVAIFSSEYSEISIKIGSVLALISLSYTIIFLRPFLAKNRVFRNASGRPMTSGLAFLTYAIILFSATISLSGTVFGDWNIFTASPLVLLVSCLVLNVLGRFINK